MEILTLLNLEKHQKGSCIWQMWPGEEGNATSPAQLTNLILPVCGHAVK